MTGFSRSSLPQNNTTVIPQPPQAVQAAIKQPDGKFKLSNAALDVGKINWDEVEQKDFHKLIGTGIFDAKPLSFPDFMNIKPKDKSYIFVWVSRLTEMGTRISQLKAAGHQLCTMADISDETPLPFEVAKDDPQGITYKDVCLMKMKKLAHLQNQEAIYQDTLRQTGHKNINRAAQQKAVELAGNAGQTYGNVFFVPMLNEQGKPQFDPSTGQMQREAVE
jgi:hypothetical protein